MQDLVEMQCMWFGLECGDSHLRRGQLGCALKRYHQIAKHFEDIFDDQFDFHTYCLRKMTLRSYVKLLRLEDRLHNHSHYVQAAFGAVECYLRLDSGVKSIGRYEFDSTTAANLTEEEKKKLESKRRRAAAKEKEQATGKESTVKDTKSEKKTKDDDPFGQKYLEVRLIVATHPKTANPLEEARKILRPMQSLCPDLLKSHWFSFEIFMRQRTDDVGL
jgi:peptide alpha-N-acetyltransferase